MKPKTEDLSDNVYSYSYFSDDDDGAWTDRRGYVYTKHGIVKVESWKSDQKKDAVTHLTIIVNGRVYDRFINAFYSARYLPTLARRFAQEVVDSVEVEA